jgi:DNA mismatch endonuclease, patch repair protein
MDTLSPAQRSAQMRRVRSADTKPELIVRGAMHRLGYRFRKHRKDLPGNPDAAFPSRRKAVFVHGCFWHRHDCPAGCRLPKSRVDFWQPKLERNAQRDSENLARLSNMGWRALVVWECETRDPAALAWRLKQFLDA